MEATKASFTEDGWFKTGDYGRVDEDGELYITGRKKFLIILPNGENIFPETVESNIMENLLYAVEVVAFEEKVEILGRENVVMSAAVYVDKNKLKDMTDEEIIEMHRNIFRRKIDEARKELSKIFGTPYDFKYGSAAALGRLLEEKGWPCHGRAKDGSYETSDDCFVEWTRDGMPGVKWLKKFRVANTCLRSYLGVTEKTVDQKRGTIKVEQTGWPQYWVKHPDGSTRIHCNFTVCGTETFRMISREPNLQNVPTHSQEGSITKMSFTVPPAAAATITDENGKKWWITELGIINTERGYVAMKALTEDDTIVDIGEETTLEFDEWMAKGIKPIGMETMLGKHNQILEGKFVLQEE